MLLAININNTNISFSLFDNDTTPLSSSSVSTDKGRTCDEYIVLIKQILNLKLDNKFSIDSCAISSVVPSITPTISTAAEYLSGCKPYIIGPGCKTGFKIAINDPACLGADIVANAAAVIEMYNSPAIVFDAGTANTITVIDENKTLVGTIIAPGFGISSSALNDNAELLDPIYFNNSDIPLIGKTTEQSIRSGLILGSAIMIDGIVRNIRETAFSYSSGQNPTLIATGSYAKIITDHCRNKFIVFDDLTLTGIASLYYNNKPTQKYFV